MADDPDRHAPLILELDTTALPDAPSPEDAPQPDDMPPAAGRALAIAAGRRRWSLGGVALGLFTALVALIIGTLMTEFVIGLFAESRVLGSVGLILLAALALALLAICLRELAALGRLGRVEGIRAHAIEAHGTGSPAAVAGALDGLEALYHRRAELAEARRRVKDAKDDMPDMIARLAYAEQQLLTPLDIAAETAIMRASRDVATATALIPLAAIDVAIALTWNLKMIRQIAQIYGGRAGWVGSWRLLKAVAAHLIATGAVALADDMLGPILGGGMLQKLSRRFGEGALNGALTARVGVAAMEVCRPLPFKARARPSASALVVRALRSWRRDYAARNRPGAGPDNE
ncbi:MAG TPA: TIGR01620 family protein [Paracoccaceae bacterium]|nr:TIGR01620 family protein [Paracoccaceae bacterium]